MFSSQALDEKYDSWAMGKDVQLCPRCKARIQKIAGCVVLWRRDVSFPTHGMLSGTFWVHCEWLYGMSWTSMLVLSLLMCFREKGVGRTPST